MNTDVWSIPACESEALIINAREDIKLDVFQAGATEGCCR